MTINNLRSAFLERMAAGLQRKSITSCSQWAKLYRVLKDGPWSFKYHPWLLEPHDSQCELHVVQKGAQLGFTELLLNVSLYTVDVKGTDVLYVLPNKTPDAGDFSTARFNPALELSPYLSKLFSSNNQGHKRGGVNNLYIRGSQSRSGLKSIPVGLVILDEVEEMLEENVTLALERTAGQDERRAWMVSTPHVPTLGINKYFLNTTQEHFFFPCPCCNRQIELVFPDSLVICGDDHTDPRIKETHLICTECKAKLPHETKCDWLAPGKYVPMFPGKNDRGFTLGQLYSTADASAPPALASLYFRGLSSISDMSEFYNSKLGLTYVAPGAQVTDDEISEAMKAGDANGKSPHPDGLYTMGVDVGQPWLHCNIDRWYVPPFANPSDLNADCVPTVHRFCKVKDFEDLDELMRKYNIQFCVIDAHPEKRKAFEFAMRFWGRVRLCYYPNGLSGRLVNINSDDGEPKVSADRTAWLDMTLGRFKTGKIRLPIDTDLEYRNHIKSLIRVYAKDANGNQTGRYEKESNKDDHYAHARNYSEIALQFAMSHMSSSNITE